MIFDVEDPQGFTHRILFDKGDVYGSENLAHGFPGQERKYVIQQVVTAAVTKKPLPFGFKLKEYL